MQFNLETGNQAKLVTDYGQGFIEVAREPYHSGVQLFRNEIYTHWPSKPALTLGREDFDMLLKFEPEILILGTGARLQFPKQALMAELHQAGAVLETMDTAAACRTYNVLVSENRKVAAALMVITEA